MPMNLQLSAILSGPFFEHDPAAVIRMNITEMLATIAADVQEQVRGDSPVLTGAFRAGVIGRVASMSGKPWHTHAVISAQHIYPWASRVGSTIRSGRKLVPTSANAQYRGGKLEAAHHMFAMAARTVRVARNLTAGIE